MGSRCAPSRDVASCIHSQQQLSTTAQSARYYQPQPRSGDGQSPWLATVTCTLHVMSAPHSTEPMVKHCTSSPRLNQQAVPYGRALSYTNHGGTSVPFNIREQLQQECHACSAHSRASLAWTLAIVCTVQTCVSTCRHVGGAHEIDARR